MHDPRTLPSRAGWRVLLAVIVAAGIIVSLLPVAGGVVVPTGAAGRPAVASGAASAGGSGPLRPGPALATPTWVNVSQANSSGAPPIGDGASSASDPVDHVTVWFGGCLDSECPSNQTWIFANGSWENVTPLTGSPPAREFASMDYDANMGGILLFGGLGDGDTPLNDTWLFAGGIWTNLGFVGPAPSARYGASLAFDPASDENGSVLYGGCVPEFLGVTCSNDTWIWRSWAGWVSVTPSAFPPAVGFAAMAWDPAASAVVLFGGCAGILCAGEVNQTWEFYANQWWYVGTTSSPLARSDLGMVWDSTVGGLVLFGGLNFTVGFLNDTWEFSGGEWDEQFPATAPSERAGFAMSLDPSGDTVLVVGGEGNVDLNDTWAFEIPPTVTIAPATTSAETSEAVTFSVTVDHGTAPFSLAVAFGDGAFSELVVNADGTVPAVHAFFLTGTFASAVTLSDGVGEVNSAVGASVHVGNGPAVRAEVGASVRDVAVAVDFVANVTDPGAGSLTYAWTFGDGANGTGANASHAYSAPGTYLANLTATDADGVDANASVSVTVVADPTATISCAPSPANTSYPVACDAVVVGGVGPYSYSWRFGDGGSSDLPAPSHLYNATGTPTVNLWVNDSDGASAHATTSLTVATPGPGSPLGALVGGAPLWFWIGIAALVAVAAIGLVVLLRRRAPR